MYISSFDAVVSIFLALIAQAALSFVFELISSWLVTALAAFDRHFTRWNFNLIVLDFLFRLRSNDLCVLLADPFVWHFKFNYSLRLQLKG